MIALDTNILVYAHRSDLPWHARAKEVVCEIAESGAAWAIPWPCVHEFLAVVTRGFFRDPTPASVALDSIEAWRESPGLTLLGETREHWATLKRLISAGRISGGAMHDARIVAICLDHGVSKLLSADRDFSRFPALKVRNPLI